MKMIILIIYCLAGIITSRHLIKNKMVFANFAHTIFFIIFGCFLFFIPLRDIEYITRYLVRDDVYKIIREVIYEPYEFAILTINILSIMTVVLIALVLIAISIIILDTTPKLKVCITCLKLKFRKDYKERRCFKCLKTSKIYLLNCELRN